MTVDVEVGGRIRTVTVHRKGHVLHVDIGGRTHVVDAKRVGDGVLSMLVASDGAKSPVRSVDVALAARPGPGGGDGGVRTQGTFDVHLFRRTIAVQIRQAGAFGRQKREGSGVHPSTLSDSGANGPQRVVAPMPGKVVRVLVNAGEEVKARQGLVVVEAMKMENELRAVREGRVRDVAVSEGDSVDAGAVLMILE